MQKKILLILSVFTIFSTGCVEFRPKKTNKDQHQQTVKTQNYTVDELKLNEFISNKSEANHIALSNDFKYNDEITLDFNHYVIEVDSFELMSEITNVYEIHPINGGPIQVFDFRRTYLGKQFSNIVEIDSKALEYILDGILIEFSNISMKNSLLCNLNQLNAKIENQLIVFSITNHLNCEIDQLISKKDSNLKIKIVNNILIDSKIKTIHDGQPFSEIKRLNLAESLPMVSQELLYSGLTMKEINPEFKVQFKMNVSRKK